MYLTFNMRQPQCLHRTLVAAQRSMRISAGSLLCSCHRSSQLCSSCRIQILHLAYELVGTQLIDAKHDKVDAGAAAARSRTTFQFWTRQLQVAHQSAPIRDDRQRLGKYVWRCLQYMRRRNGIEAALFGFL